MTTPLPAPPPAVSGTRLLRLAVLGMIEGNGHPYSWSAIINGYDPAAMTACPYPVIREYLGAQPPGTVGLPDARVTHVWTDDPAAARAVAKAALIPEVVERPEDVIGDVDAVLIATDDGYDHARRARPFVEAGLPVFVDKPLALTVEDLHTFIGWHRAGARLLSSSGFRYAPELDDCVARLTELGPLRWASGVACKTWERYGIHLLEPLLRLTGPGLTSVRLESAPGIEVAHLTHRGGAPITIPVISDGAALLGTLHLCGTHGQMLVRLTDTYTAFHRQLRSFIDFARTGRAPYPFAETVELMAALIAGVRSRQEGSRRVELTETQDLLAS